ncbi:hypothetical protein [Blastococcus sp. CCUG 61487]|uniref:hypothetical protein n=1 Tax=Blastococcus sp. CCUG 61487 TaxID=1840703 RepID=UPI0010C118C1|nr:hypothetical protein [Blastococcus sp. CCUG 61487]TKJ34764.1 hypothetical protein A6V29_14785 [Blastococcus sp. CCUG 61487]
MAVLYSDAFTGTNGAAPNAAWTIRGNTGTSFGATIQSNRMRLTTRSGMSYPTISADLLGLAAKADTEQTVTLYPPTLATSVEGYMFVRARSNGVIGSDQWAPQTGYQLWLQKNTSGTVDVFLRRYSGGVETAFGSVGNLPGTAWSPTNGLKVRFRVAGNSIMAKVWVANTAEPADWTATATDASPLAAGSAGIVATSGADSVSRSFEVDDYSYADVPTVPTVSGTVGIARYERTTTAGTDVFKYELRPDPAFTGDPGMTYLYMPGTKPPGATAKLCIAVHGWQNHPSNFLDVLGNGGAKNLTDLLLDAGYIVLVPHFSATFGNADAMARLVRNRTYAYANWTITGTVILGFSMGGGVGLIAAHRKPFPDLRGVHAIASAIDLVRLGGPSSTYELAPDLRAAYGTDAAGLAAASAAYDPQQQDPTKYTGARIRIVTSSADSYSLRPDAQVFLPKIAPYAAEAVDIDSSPALHGDFGQWANPANTVAWFDAAIAAGPWVTTTGRVVDRWNGTALVRQTVERWNGTALVAQLAEP